MSKEQTRIITPEAVLTKIMGAALITRRSVNIIFEQLIANP